MRTGVEARSPTPRRPPRLSTGRLKNMNPFIRLCGLKLLPRPYVIYYGCVGGDIAQDASMFKGVGMRMRHTGFCWLKSQSCQWPPTDSRKARTKGATGNLTSTFESEQVNRGRSVADAKGARSRCHADWRSSRSSLRWGKPTTWQRGAALVCLCDRLADHSEVNTFDNR